MTEPVALWSALPFRVFYLVTTPLTWALAKQRRADLAGDAPAAHVRGRDGPFSRRAAAGPAACRAGSGRPTPHRPRLRLRPPHRPPRDDPAPRRGGPHRRAGRSRRTCASRCRTSTRAIPLVHPDTDRVVGYVHMKDIVAALASGKRPEFMRELAREPIYASEDTRLEWLRREFQRRRVHIAIILGPGPRIQRHRDAGGSAGRVRGRDPGRAGPRGGTAARRVTLTGPSRQTAA